MPTHSTSDNTSIITLTWERVYQRIDGFGAFAGRARPLFESAQRDAFMDLLWGKEGLRLNMIRGKIFHTYEFDDKASVVTIKPPGVDVDSLHASSEAYTALISADSDEYGAKDRLAQLWILKNGLKKMKEHCQTPIAFASAWTPPLKWKDKEDLTGRLIGVKFNGLDFDTSSDRFARYLVGFARAHQEEGIALYAISPSNEPENILAPWDACHWTPDHLGEFIVNNLRPHLNNLNKNIKIIASENSFWGGGIGGNLISADAFLSRMESKYREKIDILAGHGYNPPVAQAFGTRGLNQSPPKWDKVAPTGDQRVWMTEASDAGEAYDETMTGGLRLANSMHEFLANCNVSAYVYWLGALTSVNGESLLATHSDGNVARPKAYYVMGQYSRHVRAGYSRFDSELKNPGALKVSAYKDPATNDFSVIVINTGEMAASVRIDLSGFTAGLLRSYLTSDRPGEQWLQSPDIEPQPDNHYAVKIPPRSVITFTGTGTGTST